MALFDSSDIPPEVEAPVQTPLDVAPPVGETPPQILAQEAADGHRGAAWRLMHWIMENDPRAVEAVSSLNDDRLAEYLLEFIATGTWAGKPFVVPTPLRSPYARTRLRTLFVPPSGMDEERSKRVSLSALHDRRQSVRETAIYILGLLGATEAIPALIEALHSPAPSTRLQAIKALGRTGSPEAVPALLNALHGSDEQQSSQIFMALVNLGRAAVPALIEASRSNSSWMRWHSIRALGAIHDDRALSVLVRALGDSDHGVAWMAAKGLAPFGKECIEPVLHLLITTEMTPWLRETASYVLSRQCQAHTELKPYLEPVVLQMHQPAYRAGSGLAALKAQEQLDVSHALKSL